MIIINQETNKGAKENIEVKVDVHGQVNVGDVNVNVNMNMKVNMKVNVNDVEYCDSDKEVKGGNDGNDGNNTNKNTSRYENENDFENEYQHQYQHQCQYLYNNYKNNTTIYYHMDHYLDNDTST